jgi:3-deoxy-D-manno-octulosonic-acid transferase
MARLFYSLLFYLAMPLVWSRLLWRGRRQPEYLRQVRERHGFCRPSSTRPLIWLHAVSVGETRAAEPLIEALLRDYPAHDLLLTHMTPTGRATGREIRARHPDRLWQAYLPYDLPDACGRFLDRCQPQVGLLMETEIWPNLIAAARRRRVPLALINGRLSARSQRGYTRLSSLIAPALASLSAVAAQTEADAARLQAIGARRVAVLGNLKFDVVPAPEKLALGAEWRRALGSRPVCLFASSREGEEALFLDAFAAIGARDVLLLMVPRHPQRFGEVAELVAGRRLVYRRRSDDTLPDAGTRVWLGDSMGELAAYYALADIALIGGTWLPFGGQNLIEAAACGCPVVLGPHSFNFAQASEDAIAGGAARRVPDLAAAAGLVTELLHDRRQLQTMRDAADDFSRAHGGATARTVALVRALLAESARR